MRLSAFELSEAGINTTVICDNMVGSVMKQGLIDAVIVGADRIAANGDTANKIGTSVVAILAKYYGIPSMSPRRARPLTRMRQPEMIFR